MPEKIRTIGQWEKEVETLTKKLADLHKKRPLNAMERIEAAEQDARESIKSVIDATVEQTGRPLSCPLSAAQDTVMGYGGTISTKYSSLEVRAMQQEYEKKFQAMQKQMTEMLDKSINPSVIVKMGDDGIAKFDFAACATQLGAVRHLIEYMKEHGRWSNKTEASNWVKEKIRENW